MKTIITTLPIYDAVNKQCYERSKHSGNGIIPIICPTHQLPPFQWLDGSDGAASISKVELIDVDNAAEDITSKFTLPAMIPLEHDYFVYNGATLLSTIDAGIYYLRITTNNGNIYYSEWFKADCIFGNLIGSWSNSGYAHFTQDVDITNAEYGGAGTNTADSLPVFSVRTGDVITLVCNLTVAGQVPSVKINSATLGTLSNVVNLASGANTITLTATGNAADCSIRFSNTGVTAFSTTGLQAFNNYSTKYLILEFSNSCDLGDIYYHGGFIQVLYFESEPMEMSFIQEEEGQKNGLGRFVRTYARQVKKYLARTKEMPDYMVDVFNRMKLHDTVELTDLVGDTHSVYNLEVEHEWLHDDRYYAKLDLTFDYNEVVNVSGCCTNIT